VNTADRLLSVLRLYTIHNAEWTVDDIPRQIGVSISTAYRYVRSLCKSGLLEPFDGAYILGPAIIEYDRQIRMKDPMIRVGQPGMQRLIARSGGTGVALLCQIYRDRVMCIHQEVQSSSINIVSHEHGRPMPMFRGASSKVIFANLPWRAARWFFRKFPKRSRKPGWARIGIRSSPVFGESGGLASYFCEAKWTRVELESPRPFLARDGMYWAAFPW
jgi:DNA-binding IclR family transcriptional regulator